MPTPNPTDLINQAAAAFQQSIPAVQQAAQQVAQAVQPAVQPSINQAAQEAGSSFWTPWTIALASVAGLGLLGITGFAVFKSLEPRTDLLNGAYS